MFLHHSTSRADFPPAEIILLTIRRNHFSFFSISQPRKSKKLNGFLIYYSFASMWSASPTSLFLKLRMPASTKRSLQACFLFYSIAMGGNNIEKRTTSLCSSSSCRPSLCFSMKRYSTPQRASASPAFWISSCRDPFLCTDADRMAHTTSSSVLSSAWACTPQPVRQMRFSFPSSSSSLLRSFSSSARTGLSPSMIFSSSFLMGNEWPSGAMRPSYRHVTTQEGKKEEKEEKEEEQKKKDSKKAEEKKADENPKSEPDEPRLGFFAKIRRDIKDYPNIYNKVNGMHFLLFLMFCLVSTASPTENSFWKEQLCISDKLRPLAWWMHSIITDNFLAMTYSMMMMHKLVIQMISVWGLQRVQAFVLLTAGISGAVMWLGNYMYYQWHKGGRGDRVPEFQYGPWDVVYGLLIAQYLHVSIHPIRCILSFDNWLKYASGVGTICIWYFDWQPTLLGVIVGTALCKTVPAFKVMPVKAS